MGAKGTSLLLLAALITGTVSTIGYVAGLFSQTAYRFMGALVIALILWVAYERGIRTQRYVRTSTDRERVLVYIPLYPWWGRCLLRIFGAQNIDYKNEPIFEIHVNYKTIKGFSVKELYRKIQTDLDLVAAEHTGSLFVWESHIKPPRFYRELITQKRGAGTAFLVNRCREESVGRGRCILLKALAFFQPELKKAQNKGPIWVGVFVNL